MSIKFDNNLQRSVLLSRKTTKTFVQTEFGIMYHNEFLRLFKIGFTDEAKYLTTRAGTLKLSKDGFTYLKNVAFMDCTHWRCAKYTQTRCKGKAQTKMFGGKEMMKVYGEHNHLPPNNE